MKSLSKPFYLAGVKFSDAHKLTTLPESSECDVTHEPNNPFDPFALRVTINGVTCGHIPRTEQAAWFYHVFHNVHVITKLLAFDRNRPPYEQIQCQFVCSERYMTTVVKQNNQISA